MISSHFPRYTIASLRQVGVSSLTHLLCTQAKFLRDRCSHTHTHTHSLSLSLSPHTPTICTTLRGQGTPRPLPPHDRTGPGRPQTLQVHGDEAHARDEGTPSDQPKALVLRRARHGPGGAYGFSGYVSLRRWLGVHRSSETHMEPGDPHGDWV